MMWRLAPSPRRAATPGAGSTAGGPRLGGRRGWLAGARPAGSGRRRGRRTSRPGSRHRRRRRRRSCRRRSVFGRDLEAEALLALAGQDRGALRPAFDDARSGRGRAGRRPRSGRAAPGPRRPSRRAGPGRCPRSGSGAARRPWASSGPIEARSTLTIAPASRASVDGPPAGLAQRLAEERVDRQVERRPPGRTTAAAGRPAASWVAAPRSATNDRSPSGATSTPMRPVRAPATRIDAGLHAIAANGIDERPARRVPSDRSDERRSAHRAGRASERCWPPIRPGRATRDRARRSRARAVRAGASTTSSMRSPRTTMRAGPGGGATGRPPGSARARRAKLRHGREDRRARAGALGGRRRPTYNGRPPAARPGARPMTAAVTPDLDRLAIDTIRTLSIDAVQQANSGHPGAPMGAAPMAYVLWTRFLRHAPTHPEWPDRDRFVLSAGHASMLLYSLLHLTGYDLPLDELKAFRQWGSRTPGPPGIGPDAGGRGDDRAARPGLRQRGRHGHRRAATGGRVQPRRAARSSTTGRTSSPATATSRRASRRRRRASPATCAWAS